MYTSNDKVIQEKREGRRASWELPEDVPAYKHVENSAPADAALGQDKPSDVPSSYENKHVSYQDENHFEVKSEPERLG
jgi:hypothetical protein